MKTAKWVMLAMGCGLLFLVVLTGCILPGHHGGHHGLPRPPGLPGHHGGHRAQPANEFVATATESPGGNRSPQLVENRNATTTQSELRE